MLNFDKIVNLTDEQVAEAAAAQAMAQQTQAPATSFADLLSQNEAFRQQQSENWEKREKQDRSRKALAAVSDALSSLGNLVGTTQGAFNQPQTYQMPFVVQDVEQDRALARATADRLRNYDQSLRMMEAKGAAGDSSIAGKMALEHLRQKGRSNLQSQKTADPAYLESLKQGGRIDLKQMDIDYKQDRDKIVNDLKKQGLQINRDRLDEMIRHNQTMEVIQEKRADGGRVGGYKTVIIRDEFGREISRERIPTKNNPGMIDWDGDSSPSNEDENKIDW